MNTQTLPHHKFGGDSAGSHRPWLVKTVNRRKCLQVVEVGVLSGATTRMLARQTSAARIFAVDHWQGVPDDPIQAGIYRDPAKSERVFRRKLAKEIKSGRVVVVKKEAMAAAVHMTDKYGPIFDLVFLDADHSYNAVRADIWAWSHLVRPGGILSGHDVNWPGVKQAVDEAFPRGWNKGDGFTWWVEMGR